VPFEVTALRGPGAGVGWELELWLEPTVPWPCTAPTLLLVAGRHKDDAN
jgi:hypothetical protein